MSQDVIDYIEGLKTKTGQEWQSEVCASLRQAVRKAIPDVQERLQYGKPHFLKGTKYAVVISASKAAVTFTIFNAAALKAPSAGFFEPGPEERKTVKVKSGQAPDYAVLTKLVRQAASGL